jgi:hypothetical protein
MREQLLTAFERELRARYAWAQEDQAKLQRFMAAARETLAGGNLIDRKGQAFQEALRACGLPAKITLHALHQLPA